MGQPRRAFWERRARRRRAAPSPRLAAAAGAVPPGARPRVERREAGGSASRVERRRRRSRRRGCGSRGSRAQPGEQRADRHLLPFVDDQLLDGAVGEDLDFDRRLVGVDQRDDVAPAHLVARSDPPFDQRAGFHVRAERRHAELVDVGGGAGVMEPGAARAARRRRWSRPAAARLLEMRGIRHRHLGAAHALDRRIELVERVFHDPRRDLRRDAAAAPAFVDDHCAARLRTDSITVASSSGRSVRRSITSASMPSAASVLGGVRASCTASRRT